MTTLDVLRLDAKMVKFGIPSIILGTPSGNRHSRPIALSFELSHNIWKSLENVN